MLNKIKVAILISGRGSNMEKLIESCQNPNSKAEIVVVGSNKINALGLNYATKNSISTFVIDQNNFKSTPNSRQEFDNELFKELSKYKIDLICLAGFMRILSADFINKFKNRIINIHPSLLPDFKGANAVLDAINAKASFAGCSTHFVIPEIDSGEIIMQSKIKVEDNDDVDSLSRKILVEEHKIYPQTLQLIAQKILNQNL